MKFKKTWLEKLRDNEDLPKVVKIEGKMSRKWGEGTVVIPAPMEVDALMKKVPKGKVITINEIRQALANKHGATIGCPITTGIFAWVAAHAVEEDTAQGKRRIAPYWRTLKMGGELNPKYPGGIIEVKNHLVEEGHKAIAMGKKYIVENYDKHLAKLKI